MQLAASARVPVILDAGGAESPLAHELLTNVSILSPNETELERMTGMPTKTEKQCIEAAENLVHQGVNKVLVKLGAKGSLLVGALQLIGLLCFISFECELHRYKQLVNRRIKSVKVSIGVVLQIFMETQSNRKQKK